MIRLARWLLLLLCALTLWNISMEAEAHEVRPGYLALTETAPGDFGLLWKLPVKDGAIPKLELQFDSHCQVQWSSYKELTGDASITRGSLHCGAQGLGSQPLLIKGLAVTLIDVLVRIEWLDGSVEQQLLKPDRPLLSRHSADQPLLSDYIVLGFEHILEGYDHLLFVAALLLVVVGFKRLLMTITAFTLAHSITLGLATFGVLDVPSAPVEAIIAFSIALVAAQALRSSVGHQQSNPETSKPWVMAFGFGLLHGLGFAGALSDVGLPDDDIPLALLLFNLGIEAGQVVFVLAILLALRLYRSVTISGLSQVYRLSAYAIGSMGMFWMLDRTVGMVM